MRYSIELRDRIYAKGCGLMSLCLNKYSQKIIDTAKKSATDAIKTASQQAIQKTAEATRDLVGNKIADKITIISKKATKNLLAIDKDAELPTRTKKMHITGRKTTNC